jgi:nucleotide-binding universal stress UspA family protein
MSESTESVPQAAGQTAPIVVGVDGSPASGLALRWAIREAEASSNPVLAISAYSIPAVAASAPGYDGDTDGLADECRSLLAAEIAAASKDHPAVRIESKVVEGPAALALIEASLDASALMVGSSGRGGLVGLLLGSVSQQCVAHAICPVVVVRPRKLASKMIEG